MPTSYINPPLFNEILPLEIEHAIARRQSVLRQSIHRQSVFQQCSMQEQAPTFLIESIRLETIVAPPIRPQIDEDLETPTDMSTEPMWRVLLHNDNVTPMEYVLLILEHLFFLSSELAEHVMWTAHTEGTAVVVLRSRSEADRLIKAAHGKARLDGFPLTFSMEPD